MSDSVFWTVCVCRRPREWQTFSLWEQVSLEFGNLSGTRSWLEEPHLAQSKGPDYNQWSELPGFH